MMVEGFRISSDLEDMDIEAIHAYISRSYWARGIPVETLKRGIENSLCCGVFTESGKQVGFARMVTDSATFAYLCDVYVLEDYRAKGLSKWMVDTMLQHPKMQGLRRICLATADAHGLYERYGFEPLANPHYFLEIWRPEIYDK